MRQTHYRQAALMDAPAKADIAFLRYHHDNPQVYAMFKRIAVSLLERGVTHYGAKAVMEIVRYQTLVSANGGKDGEVWKINNNHTSRYARLLAAEDSRFVTFFEFRQLRTPKGRAA